MLYTIMFFDSTPRCRYCNKVNTEVILTQNNYCSLTCRSSDIKDYLSRLEELPAPERQAIENHEIAQNSGTEYLIESQPAYKSAIKKLSHRRKQ